MLDHQPGRINGICRQALDDVLEKIGDSSRSMASLRVATRWTGQVSSESRIEAFTCTGQEVARNITISVDEPAALLGADAAPNPQELLLSAVNACMVMGYVVQASIRGISLRDCRIEAEGEVDLRGLLGLEAVAPGFRRLSYVVYLDGDGTKAQYEEIHEAVMSTSPNFFTLSQPIQMCGRLA